MRYTDIQLQNNGDYYDLAIGSDGDFVKTNSFDTALLLSIFCERRASETEVPEPSRRRGWIGNFNNPVEYGSKLWLLYQARLTNSTVNRARDYLQQCLQWLVDFGYLRSVVVTTERNDDLTGVIAQIRLERFNSEVEYLNYTLWENTGGN